MFEKMSPEMKNQYLFQLTDEDEKKALIELMDIENSKALKNRINTRLQEFATQQKTTQDRVRKPDESASRHAKRVSRQHLDYTNMLSQASGMDFNESGRNKMKPKEIDESLMGLVQELEPSLPTRRTVRHGKRVSLNPVTGEATVERDLSKNKKPKEKETKT